MIIRLMKPIVTIRFRSLPPRLGDSIVDVEFYLCNYPKDFLRQKRIFDIFYHSSTATNTFLKKIWDRTLTISPIAKYVDIANRWFPGYHPHVIPNDIPYFDIDTQGLLDQTPPHISLTIEEERQGKKELEKLGISNAQPFICFHIREASYLNERYPSYDWRYHNYRDSNIQACIPAAEKLAARGYAMIRMGSVVKEALHMPPSNPAIIDYAVQGRTDFMDVYLIAKCAFFIGSTAGLSSLPRIFRRPIAYINFIPYDHLQLWGKDYLFIPKKLWLKKEKRFLTFKEIFSSEIKNFYDTSQYEAMGIELMENTPEEISALGLEMEDRINGRWTATQEDEELQEQFRSLARLNPRVKNAIPIRSRIGAAFLRENQALLISS